MAHCVSLMGLVINLESSESLNQCSVEIAFFIQWKLHKKKKAHTDSSVYAVTDCHPFYFQCKSASDTV